MIKLSKKKMDKKIQIYKLELLINEEYIPKLKDSEEKFKYFQKKVNELKENILIYETEIEKLKKMKIVKENIKGSD